MLSWFIVQLLLVYSIFQLTFCALIPDDDSHQLQSQNNDTRPIAFTTGIPYRPLVDKPSGAPGADLDPDGVHVYESLADVPTSKLLGRSLRQSQCVGDDECWKPYICGHRCEPILLAIRSFCKRKDANNWVRCTKPRKFRRCFARVCFRRALITNKNNFTPNKPKSFEDPYSVAVVRWRKNEKEFASKIKEKRVRKILLEG